MAAAADIKTKKYNLELSGEQLQVLESALTIFYEVARGRLGVIQEYFRGTEDDFSRHLESALRMASYWLNPALPPTMVRPITDSALPDDARMAHDIAEVLRHFLAYQQQPEGTLDERRDRQFAEPNLIDNVVPVKLSEVHDE